MSSKPKSNPFTWVKSTQADVKAARDKNMKEKGLAEFYSLEEGETTVTFDPSKEPRQEQGDFGAKFIFRVQVNGKDYDLSTSTSLANKILIALSQNINPITIIRVGEDKQTRFSIKELRKKKD